MAKHRSARDLLEENTKPRRKLRRGQAELKSTVAPARSAASPVSKRSKSKSTRAHPEPTQDIAGRTKIEEELREAEQKANDLIRYAPTAIYEIDFRGPRFTHVNDATCQMSGYTREELLAMNPFDLMDANSQKVFRDRIRATLAGEPVDESVEYRVRVKDGSDRFALLKTRLLYEQGKPTGAFVIAHDITERRQAEQLVRESEEKYRTLFENATDAILVLDPLGPGKVLSANPAACRLFGYQARELLELNRDALLDTSDPHLAALMDQRDQAGPVTTMLTYKRKDGTRFTGELRRTLVHDSAGCLRAVSIVRDVTERTRAEQALRGSEERQVFLLKLSDTLRPLADAGEIQQTASRVLREHLGSDRVVYWEFTGDNQITPTGADYAPGTTEYHSPLHLADYGEDLAAEFRAGRLVRFDDTTQDPRLTDREQAALAKNASGAWVGVPLIKHGQPVAMLSTVCPTPHRWTDTEVALIQEVAERTWLATQWAHAEEALRETERNLAEANRQKIDILESISDCFYGLDEDLRFTYVNQAAEKIWGLSWADLLGRKIEDAFPSLIDISLSKFRQVLKEHTPQYYEVYSQVIQRWGEMYVYPTPDGISVYFHDITERKRAEEVLEIAHRHTTEVLESIQDGFYALDREWRFTYINSRAAMNVGAKPEELIGHTLWERFPQIVGTAHEANYRQAMDERVPVHFEMDGVLSQAVYDIRVYPSADGISVYSLDITERKQIEQKLQKLNCELEDQKTRLQAANLDLESFSYSVSHDLRAPLGSIDGFTSMILKNYSAHLTPEIMRLLELVHENSQQMSRLIEALLLLSRTSRHALARQTVAPREVAEDVLKMLQPQLEGRQVEIAMADLPPCQADPVLLRQVYANLLSNALKFTRNCTTAHIEVGYKMDEGEAVYFVKDNGVGFSMDQAGRLFGVFQRLHSEEEYEGTGIGLAIVQRIIRRHGGRVWAEGEIEKGATFYFTL